MALFDTFNVGFFIRVILQRQQFVCNKQMYESEYATTWGDIAKISIEYVFQFSF